MGGRGAAGLLSGLAGALAPPAIAADLACVIETRCTAAGCTAPVPAMTFGLRLVEGAALFLTPTGQPAGFGLPAVPGAPPARMQVYAGPDGNGYALLSLRDDGAIALSVHAGRMAGPPADDSALALGRCEVPA